MWAVLPHSTGYDALHNSIAVSRGTTLCVAYWAIHLFLLQIEEDLQKEVKQVEYALEGDLKSFGRGFTVLEKVILPCFAVCAASRCHE